MSEHNEHSDQVARRVGWNDAERWTMIVTLEDGTVLTGTCDALFKIGEAARDLMIEHEQVGAPIRSVLAT